MPKATALDHLVLVVRDVERSLAWYGRHLGLMGERVEEWRAGEVPFPSMRVDANTIIDFVRGDPREPGHVDHLCFVVSEDDLAALRRSPELEIESEGERFGARGLAQSIYVTDPDGLTVEIRAYPS
jgi:catechol 2,3-dioxygenase-like lactoylglutathione lyase family enzyme